MANSIGGSVVWNLDVDDKGLQSGLSNARKSVSDTAKEVDNTTSTMASNIVNSFKAAQGASLAFAGALAGIGIAGAAAVGFGVKMAADIETAKQGFTTLLGSVDKANAAIDQIKKDAASTPFEFSGLVRANQMLTSVTKNADQSEKLLLNVGKALSAAGKSGAELDNVIVNLQQIANTSHISELDIRQFGFAGINILELLADYYGTTKEAAGEMVKVSKNAFADLEGAFAKAGEGGGRFARAFIDQAGTFNQLMSNFRDIISQTAADIVTQTGIFDAVKQGLSGIINTLVSFKPSIVQGIKDFMGFVTQNAPIIVGLILGGLIPAFYGLATAIAASTIQLLPFMLAGAALVVLGKLIIDALGGWDATMNLIGGAIKMVGKAYNAFLKPAVDELIKQLKIAAPEFMKLLKIISPVLIPALKLLAILLGGVVLIGLRAMIEIITAGVRAFTVFYDNVRKIRDGIVSFGKSLGDLYGFLKQVGDLLIQFFTGADPTVFAGQSAAIVTFAKALSAVRDVILNVGEAIGTFFQQLPTMASNAVNSVVQFFVALPGRLRDALVNAGLAFVEWIGFVTGLVVFGVPKIIDAIVNFFVELPGKVATALVAFATVVVGGITAVWNWVTTTVPVVIDSIVGFFATLPERVATVMTQLWTTLVIWFTSIWTSLSTLANQIVTSVVTFFSQLPGKMIAIMAGTRDAADSGIKSTWAALLNEVSQWPGRLFDWGVKIIQAFADGIKSAIGAIVDAFKQGMDRAKRLVEGHSPPIEGPFKDIDKWGFNIGMAWVDGMKDAISSFSLQGPTMAGVKPQPSSDQVGPSNVSQGISIQVGQMNVREQSDITAIARELGFRVEMSPLFVNNG